MLEGKVAIVTGGTRGIGLEIVHQFLLNGAKVALFGSKKESVNKALESLKKENDSYPVIGFYKDLTNEKEVEKVFQSIEDQFGKIDILVNNAGLSSKTPLEELSIEEFDNVMGLNIKAAFVCSKKIVKHLKKTSGVILNTSSMVSLYAQPSGSVYPISKFAINGLTKSLARELAPLKIRVNAVAPGIIETDMVKSLPKEMIEPLIKTIPLGRIGTPKDIANAFLFLASDMASYITGEILQVDGAARS